MACFEKSSFIINAGSYCLAYYAAKSSVQKYRLEDKMVHLSEFHTLPAWLLIFLGFKTRGFLLVADRNRLLQVSYAVTVLGIARRGSFELNRNTRSQKDHPKLFNVYMRALFSKRPEFDQREGRASSWTTQNPIYNFCLTSCEQDLCICPLMHETNV